MTIRTRLFTRADVEKQLLSKARLADTDEPDYIEEIGICPIVELLELCELIKKDQVKASLSSFREGMQAFQDSLVRHGQVQIINLDKNCLISSLFEWDDDYAVTGLWAPAANREIIPTHSVRRLLLRPSDQTWWDDDIYAAAEAIYESIEGL